jgi:NAD(P)-dependent dehydrogenase (short-subunit alcohol dehydrogenase family)
MERLEGKVAVITGGSSGIALATPALFCGEGAKVAIAGRDQKALDKALHSPGGVVIAVGCDVRKPGGSDTCCSPEGTKAAWVSRVANPNVFGRFCLPNIPNSI